MLPLSYIHSQPLAYTCIFAVLGFEPEDSCMLSKYSTAEPSPWLRFLNRLMYCKEFRARHGDTCL
jgi:hypothetical protein